ncbi:MAG: hypothetical protein LC637_06765 [Xanthomonadaceae bacterium]|nr:hypothetical protein [Xanthomonadaceae bacterium]
MAETHRLGCSPASRLLREREKTVENFRWLRVVLTGPFGVSAMQKDPGKKQFCRLLIVEDSAERERLFREWIPDDFRITFVKSAGRALKVLELDAGRVYAGVLLDHDLDQAVALESELQLSGRQVVERMGRLIDPDVPVFIHSVNPLGARMMEQNLVEYGFDVTRVPFFQLDQARLGRWLAIVWEEWEAGLD